MESVKFYFDTGVDSVLATLRHLRPQSGQRTLKDFLTVPSARKVLRYSLSTQRLDPHSIHFTRIV